MREEVHSVGVDAVEIGRVAAILARFGDRFLQRVYTAREMDYCDGKVRELAARFAAKEAVSKALGTGLRGVGWREIEVLPDRRGRPLVHLHGRAASRAREIGLATFAISLTHSRELAIAFVVASRDARGCELTWQ